MPGTIIRIKHSDSNNVMTSFREQCGGYIVKLINKAMLLGEVCKLLLIEERISYHL